MRAGQCVPVGGQMATPRPRPRHRDTHAGLPRSRLLAAGGQSRPMTPTPLTAPGAPGRGEPAALHHHAARSLPRKGGPWSPRREGTCHHRAQPWEPRVLEQSGHLASALGDVWPGKGTGSDPGPRGTPVPPRPAPRQHGPEGRGDRGRRTGGAHPSRGETSRIFGKGDAVRFRVAAVDRDSGCFRESMKVTLARPLGPRL